MIPTALISIYSAFCIITPPVQIRLTFPGLFTEAGTLPVHMFENTNGCSDPLRLFRAYKAPSAIMHKTTDNISYFPSGFMSIVTPKRQPPHRAHVSDS